MPTIKQVSFNYKPICSQEGHSPLPGSNSGDCDMETPHLLGPSGFRLSRGNLLFHVLCSLNQSHHKKPQLILHPNHFLVGFTPTVSSSSKFPGIWHRQLTLSPVTSYSFVNTVLPACHSLQLFLPFNMGHCLLFLFLGSCFFNDMVPLF